MGLIENLQFRNNMDNFEYLRRLKADAASATYGKIKNKTGCLKVEPYDDVELIIEYTDHPKAQPTFNRSNANATLKHISEKARHISGTVLFGGFFINHWGHFLVETLARLWYLYQDSAEKIEKVVFVSENPDFAGLHGNMKQFFELAGLSDIIEVVTSDVSCDRLIVPEMALSHWHTSQEYGAIFNSLIRKVLSSATECEGTGRVENKKVFLTRSKLKNATRKEINIECVDKFFQNNGYTIISPEKLMLKDLVIMMSDASEIVSINGTLAHNVLFAPQGVDFTVLERHGFINSWQMGCNIAKGIDGTYVDCYELPTISNPIGSVFLYEATEQFQQWACSKGMTVTEFSQHPAALKKELKRFLRLTTSEYGHTPVVLPYDLHRGSIYMEAMLDSERRYYRWARRQQPLFLSDYFSLSCHKKWWLSSLVRKILR